MHKTLFAVALACSTVPPTAAAAPEDSRGWTLEDIVTAPEVTDVALAENGRFAIYAVHAADIDADKYRWTLRLIDLQSGSQRDLLTADQAEQLRSIPQSDAWSAILDIGDGMQLYRIERSGEVTPLLIHRPTVYAGAADMALYSPIGAPRYIGIVAHSWSPDGRWLWYSVLKARDNEAQVRFDKEVIAARHHRRSRIDAIIEIHIRASDGTDSIVTTRPAEDVMARYYGGDVVWQGDEVFFLARNPDGSEGGAFETRAWHLTRRTLRTVASTQVLRTFRAMNGPRGGQLETSGTGDRFELIETFEDGGRYSYGRFPFRIGDPRSAGLHRSANGQRVIVGTRTTGNPRYGLVLITRDAVREIGGQGSFTKCDFSSDLAIGVCIREGISDRPEVVRIDAARNQVVRLAAVSPRHEKIQPLDIRPRLWVNRLGYEASGYVVLPRGYVVGRRYPTIVVTHGSDADERFASIELQWEYPVQLFAERGYVVLLINDPRPRQSPELYSAYQAWSRGDAPPEPEDVQRLAWLNGVYSFEDAVKEMVAEGLVDPERVGIAGYSRGSQMVNVTLTNSRMFRAASGGDGSYLYPLGYANSQAGYNAIYGGSPFGEHIEQYRRFSPTLNGDRACGALLQQVAKPRGGAIDFHTALRDHHVPAQLTLYPGESAASSETHVFHIPSNRLRAQRENIAWFDYWLLGQRDPNMIFPERLAIWDAMAADPNRPTCDPQDEPTD